MKLACTKFRVAGLLVAAALLTTTTSAEQLPGRLQGSWRITRVIPTSNRTCWNTEQAAPLVGSTITYKSDSMTWRGGQVPVAGIVLRDVSAEQFAKENSSEAGAADFAQLGIRSRTVTEVDFQHEDMDITGSTTEVPGDSVLMVGPNRIVVSACGVFFEATRGAAVLRASGTGRSSAGR